MYRSDEEFGFELEKPSSASVAAARSSCACSSTANPRNERTRAKPLPKYRLAFYFSSATTGCHSDQPNPDDLPPPSRRAVWYLLTSLFSLRDKLKAIHFARQLDRIQFQ